uniref:Uncharacterized protein n=1 Tax=Romanomermis culicivorax TaxID=13658 RepID=A0A915K783_ROMCU
MALLILGPEVARQALEFISNGTIWATPFDKILLEGEPLWPAVDAIRGAIEQASQIPQPAPAIATLPPKTTMSAQMLSMIAQQQPSAATTNSPTEAGKAFGETFCTVSDGVSIIKALPSLSATVIWSLKDGLLREFHP